jgi:hypothetical protein
MPLRGSATWREFACSRRRCESRFREKFFLAKNFSRRSVDRFLFFSPAKNRAVVRILQQDSAKRAFNKLARAFAAQVETLKRYRGGGEAAMYIGVSPCKFDEMIRDHRMPAPKRIDGRNGSRMKSEDPGTVAAITIDERKVIFYDLLGSGDGQCLRPF